MTDWFLVISMNDAAEMLDVPRRPRDTVQPNIHSFQALLTATQLYPGDAGPTAGRRTQPHFTNFARKGYKGVRQTA